MLTDPHADEFRCLGPVHKTASKAMMPSHATRVDAQSWLIRRANWLPRRPYHASGSSTRDSAKAFWLRLFQTAATSEAGDEPGLGVDSPLEGLGAGAGMVSWDPKMYSPFKRGIPTALDPRQAYCRAPRSFRSFRFVAPRMDKIRTEKDGSTRISWTSSAVTDKPSRQRTCTSRRMLVRRRLEKTPRSGPE
jgi:hypothetical protein